MVIVELNNQTKKHVCRRKLDDLLNFAQKYLKSNQSQVVSIAFVGETVIRRLNKQYRHKDKVTDVLSFENKDKLVQDEPIGEIIVCTNKAIAQAKKLKHSFDKEVWRLVLHGYLHLLGYDHIKNKEAEEMERLEEKIINKFYDKIKKAS